MQRAAATLAAWFVTMATVGQADPAGPTARADPAGGASPYDFSTYLQKQEFEASEAAAANHVEPSEVVVNGIPYIKLTSRGGSLFLPKVTHITREDLERGLCGTSFAEGDLSQATVAGAELQIQQDAVLYASIVVETTRTRCDGAVARTAPRPTAVTPEVGVKVKGKGRTPNTYKLFNNPLQGLTNVGIGADF